MGEAVLAEFLCPICISYMAPSIRQCVQGHLFCSQCFNNIERCGICRNEKSDVSCLALEKVHALLTFPCRYKDDGEGCDYTGKSSELAAHETSCQPMECPLKLRNCQWHGKFSELSEHCKLEHDDVFFESDKLVVCTRWFQTPQRKHIIMKAFDTLFWCNLKIEPNCLMQILVGHMGNPFITNQFSLNVYIIIRYEENILKSICYKEYEYTPRFQTDEYLTFSYYPAGTLRKGCYISFVVEIFRK